MFSDRCGFECEAGEASQTIPVSGSSRPLLLAFGRQRPETCHGTMCNFFLNAKPCSRPNDTLF